MKIRTFEPTDIDTILSLWNKVFPHDAINKKQLLRKVILDPNFSAGGLFIAEEEGKILGFVNSIYRKVPICPGSDANAPTSFISMLAIEKEEDVLNLGGILLDSAENYLKKHGKTRISTGYAPLYINQGVEKNLSPAYVRLYEERGYTGKPSCARVLDLTKFFPNEKIEERRANLKKEGIYIGPMKDQYLLSLINPDEPFNNQCWAMEFKARAIEMDYDRIRIAAKDGHVIGACAFGDPESSIERFGPFGVNKDMQGKGIGGVLLSDCLFEMKKRSLYCAWALWTPADGPAAALYEKIGFKTVKDYLTFEKEWGEDAHAI